MSDPQSTEKPESIDIFICGPQTAQCKCNCPNGCEHQWDGETVQLMGTGRSGKEYVAGESASCSRCGMVAMEHDLWVLP